ncbi:MAG: amphi-Trp domain-containing protein, partial [Halobacteriaceae archaeon]
YMTEEVLFKSERTYRRKEISDYLQSLATAFQKGEKVTLTAGDQEVTIDPPEQSTFEIDVERESGSSTGPGEISIELELEWQQNSESIGGGLEINTS